ncbi:MAG: DNA repair protein RadA [Vicinamibacterales bacterium]
MKAPKAAFVCQECGSSQQKWVGRCPDCGAWNSMVEERPTPSGAAGPARYALAASGQPARRLSEVDIVAAERVSSGVSEFDRVLGGGIVPGSLVLLGGEPGIGKSTLVLQAAAHFATRGGPVLYCSGEESEPQVKARAERLGIGDVPLFLLAETCMERILDEVARIRPTLLVVDSIQTVFSTKLQSAPGSVGQVREAATELLFAAKGQGIPTFLIGHVTKEGNLAGPKTLEHIVDTVLYFEGERHHAHRIVRAIKNRFGPVSELGVFEMTGTGLRAVGNPSKLFLAERAAGVSGSAVFCAIEGTRPLLVEMQALVASTNFANPRRMTSGIDQNRLSLLLAVLEKRAGLNLSGEDVFVNVAGGIQLDEPAADLAILGAVSSSLRNRPIRPGTAVCGEVGLAGEVRSVPQASLRLREASQLGFSRCVMPAGNVAREDVPPGIELVPVTSVAAALEELIDL